MDIAAWFAGLPRLTRVLLSATVALSVAAHLRLVPVHQLFLSWPDVLGRLQLHRLLSAFLLLPVGLQMLFHIFMLFQYSSILEMDVHGGRTADYATYLAATSLVSAAIAAGTATPLLADSLLLSVVTAASLAHPDRIVSFYFGIRFESRFLPLALVAFEFLASEGRIPYASLIGIASAYAVITLSKSNHPGQRPWISTPRILREAMPDQLPPQGAVHNTAATSGYTPRPVNAAAEREANDGMRYRWGQGNRLGTQ